MRLKKILAAVLATAMVATCVAVPAKQAKAEGNADTKIMYADTSEGDGYTVNYLGHWIDPETNTARLITNRAYMGGSTASLEAYTAGHKPVGNAGDSKGVTGRAVAQIIFTFNVETAGEYAVNFYYAAQYKSDTAPRSFAVMVNAGDDNEYADGVFFKQYEYLNSAKKTDEDVLAILDTLKANGIVGDGGVCSASDAEGNGGWFKIVSQSETITLQAGENKIAICSPTDFDDSTIKGINFYAVEYKLSKAATTPTPEVVKVGEEVNLATSDKVTLEGLADGVQDKNMKLDGVQVSDKVIGLKPAGDGSSKVSFTVEAEKAGTYEIAVVYNAKGSNRPMAIKVNDEKAKDVALPSTSDSNYTDCGVKKISVHLNKGENVITFSQASNYDNNNVKTPNLVSVKTTLTKADAPETPSTGVAAVAIPVAVVMLASGAVAVKASKKDEQ